VLKWPEHKADHISQNNFETTNEFLARNKFMAYKGTAVILPVTELRIVCPDFTFQLGAHLLK